MKDSNSVPLRSNSSYDPKGNGVVYTPAAVTEVVVAQALAKLDVTAIGSVLEPSCGDGSFVRTLLATSSLNIYALDKDEEAITHCKAEFDKAHVYCGDFFEDLPEVWPKQFDIIIGNPPYVSWHRCDPDTRSRLDRIGEQYDFEGRHLRNAWAGFVVKATMKLAQKGVLAFVIPYEFLTVSYGKRLRDWMEGHFTTLDIYIPNEKAFKSIDQDAVTVIATKGEGPCETVLHRVASLETAGVQSSCRLSSGAIKAASLEMKGFLLDSEVLNLIQKIDQNCERVSDFCDNAAGTVTAANDYFILSRADLEFNKLTRWARPIIKKSSFLGDAVSFSVEHFDELESTGKACYLLDFSKLHAEKLPKAVQRYIELGEEEGIDQRYKCRHRKDWFKVPVVQPNEGFFFKRSHIVPRFCVNECGVLATDSAYHIRMKPGVAIHDLCASFYNSLTLLFAEIEGRFYGGGVLEVTPNEFRRLPVPLSEFSASDFSRFEGRFTLADGAQAAIQFSNDRLMAKLQLSTSDLDTIEGARQTLQRHRLRHGGKSQS
ncbi:Methyltransferase domain-containing protein [Salipiger thiooxidans]|uniref:site-specific DNA-methyltransferase (adenine-specific) n=1 Tax=Salipiger thiooxidans TaxID=282683 RepID=A0A1G7DMX4_9RHOB|nr:N-6 DNA methylase [Salipiger thiooxidans]SDE52843.1 Methyltransferase domain-containing protein [Salipiger thiooxidans]